jgi:hypothetical protein
VLVDPANRLEAVDAGYRLATACHLSRCRATADRAVVREYLAAHAVPLALAFETWESFELPALLLRDVATSCRLGVHSASRLSTTLELGRDLRGEPLATLALAAAPPERQRPEIDAYVALGVVARPPTELTGDALQIPLYADAFPLVAHELVGAAYDYIYLDATVAAAHAVELAMTAPAMAELTLDLDRADRDALLPLTRTSGAIVVRWDEPGDSEVWIRYVRPDGLLADDGRIYDVTLHLGVSLEVGTIIDHCGTATAEAWLAERAGARVRYCAPGS